MKIFKDIFIFLCLSTNVVYAMRCGNVVSYSATGKTIKLAIGALHGLRDGDRAQMSVSVGTLSLPKYEILQIAELVKIYPNYSYWFSATAPRFKNDLVNKKVCLLINSNSLEGRVDGTFSYRQVGHEGNISDEKFPSDLIQQKDVRENFVYKNTKIEKRVDRELISHTLLANGRTPVILDEDYEEIKYLKSKQQYYDRDKLTKSINNKIIEDQHLQQLKKVNDLKYGYDELYYEVGRSNDVNKLQVSSARVIDEYRDEKFADIKIPKNTKIMLTKEGKLWSADMDKHELKDYLMRSGIAYEEQRKENVLSLKSGNEISFFVSSNLTPNYTTEDDNHQNNGLSIGILYDFHLVRSSRDLVSWTIDIVAEQGIYNVDVGGINSRIAYGAFAGHLNYYFVNYPHSLNRFAWFAGAGIKRGNGTAGGAGLSKEYEYQITSIPSMHLGLKYRIPAARKYELNSNLGFGVTMRLNYEVLKLTSLSTIEDNIQANRSLSNTKLDIGLSIFF